MTNFKIANILLSEDPQFLGSPAMLCHSTRPWLAANNGEWLLKGPGTHDFTTFFNALSVQKWREYTVAQDYVLHLEVKGAACTFVQTYANAFSYYSTPVEGSELAIPASDDWQTFDIDLQVVPTNVLVAFQLTCEGDIYLKNSYYAAKVDQAQVREVELALCTTTFKKEAYITRNIGLVKKEILGSDELIAKHFNMHVVDNGRTLDADALASERVTVHPNDNAGGAGGFARGMIEAMGQSPVATHVLLMDDDVLISTESIKRTYNLLCLLNDEYKDAFVSGAMMNMDEPYIRWEDMGFMAWFGGCRPLKPTMRMDVLHDVVNNESFDIPSYIEGWEDQSQHYAAWWFCVIPMTQIKKNGLPMPVFVRFDDVEYSLRCKPKFITMNGICIWHMSFHLRYNAAQERYQTTRNQLIDAYTWDFAPLSNFNKQIKEAFEMEVTKFNYTNAALLLDGLEDFLKGPEWIMQPVAQKAFMDANKHAEKLVPFEDAKEELEKLGVDVNELTDWKITRDWPLSRTQNFIWNRTQNGNVGATSYTKKGKVVVVDAVGWALPRARLMHAETVVAVDVPNCKVAIRHLDREKYQEVKARFDKDMRELRSRDKELKKAYSSKAKEMTSVEFWKKYLGI